MVAGEWLRRYGDAAMAPAAGGKFTPGRSESRSSRRKPWRSIHLKSEFLLKNC